ncbi:MAG: PKD domain-containing protein [Candidatus Hydrogenedens sp.]
MRKSVYFLCFQSILFFTILLTITGCPREEVGGYLIVEPTSVDLGSNDDSADILVWKNTTTSSIGPIVVESQIPWISVEGCATVNDECYSLGPLDKKRIRIRIDREKTDLGPNSGNIIVRATNAPSTTVLITLIDLIKVDFDASSKFTTVNEAIRFFNQSAVQSGTIRKVTWDFGDGQTSNDYNPTYFYQKPGNYTVTLTVETDKGIEKRVKENFINVISGNLTVDFSASSQIVLLGEEVQLIDRSRSEKENIINRFWDFGDGKTSNEVNPRHKYENPGIYSVTLTVYTENQNKSLTKEGYITVQEGVPPKAKFSVSQIKPFIYIPVQFSDLSEAGSSPITDWLWDFGDGNTSTEQNPQYAFTRIGNQQIKLTVKNKFGISSFSLPVEVIYLPPTAEFSAEPLVLYEGESVFFADLSIKGTERIIRWLWNFGDGGTETIEYQPYSHENGNTRYAYAQPGIYSVSLTVNTSTTSNNESSITKSSYITVHKPPVPQLSVSTRSPVIQKEVLFLNRTAIGTETELTFEWNFGDGSPVKTMNTTDSVSHIYSEAGVYDVTLKVKTPLKTFESEPVKVYVDAPPIPDFEYTPKRITVEDLVQFTDLSNSEGTRPIIGWVWSFGDGSGVSTMQNPTHRFESPGKYKVELYLVFTHSKSGEQLKTSAVSKTLTIGSAIPPTAGFKIESPCAIVGSEVKFYDQSKTGTAPIVSWEWDFGDGETSNDPSPIHVYSTPGTYTVKLKVQTEGGLESEVVKQDCIDVSNYASPLDIFVRERDSEYTWTTPVEYPVNYTSGSVSIRLATAYITRMTSQAWREADDLYSGRIWKHNLAIIVPERKRNNTALLFIDGGNINSNPPNESERLFFGELAALSGSVIVHIDNVPNQPIVFIDDYDAERNVILKSRTEDDIIAYSYDKYMNEYKNGNDDYHWPLLLAMAKSAVRAMDTTQFILEDNAPSEFIISGGSKRGWTTWLTGLTDCRIKAIAPLVIDVLNMDKQMEHHKNVYGYWAPSIYAYAQMKVFDRLIPDGGNLLPEAEALLKLIDPYEYLERTQNIPKFILNSSCDEFFVPDSSLWYFKDLLGEKYLNYVPNVSHGLGNEFSFETDAVQNLFAWFLAKTQNIQLPTFTWQKVTNGNANTLQVVVNSQFTSLIKEVKLWQCNNPYARDFRKYKIDSIGVQYQSEILQPVTPGVYQATVNTPSQGYTAYFIQLTFNNPARFQMAVPGLTVPSLVYTTSIYITPETYPEYTSERYTNYKYPYLVLRGSPYEMGRDYGDLMRNEIINHANYVLSNLGRFGVTQTNLDNAWSIQQGNLDERIQQELQGISDSTGINYDALGKLQLVECLSPYSTTKSSGSLLWSTATNMPSFFDYAPLIQTYSLNRQLYNGGQQTYPVVIFYIPEHGFPHVLFTFAGMVVSRAGVNVAGLTYGDIPVSGESVVLNENMLTAFRSAMYDVNRLNSLIEWTDMSSLGRLHSYLLGDGRYELRGAKYLVKSSSRLLVRDNDTNDDYRPNILPNIVYDADTATRANNIYTLIRDNYGQLVISGLYTLSQRGAVANSNLMNLVIDATALKGYIAVANGTQGASTQTFEIYDFQSILP